MQNLYGVVDFKGHASPPPINPLQKCRGFLLLSGLWKENIINIK